MLSPKELNARLVDKIELALAWLFKGAGSIKSGRFSIGNIDGDEGDSLFVYLRDGRFKDAATSEHGDILELFSLKLGGKVAGIEAAYSFLGIHKPMKEKKIVNWKKPKRDWTQLTENPAVLEYLTKERKIPLEILSKYNVRAKENEFFTFLCYTHDLDDNGKPMICGSNYIGISLKANKSGKLKKNIFQQPEPLATLWGHTATEKQMAESGKTFLIITEGQIDAMSVAAQGYNNVVSVPFGATADGWIENSWDFMMGFDEIYLFFDSDEEGLKSRDAAAKRIGFEKCRKVEIPGHYKDANAAHKEGYDLSIAINAAKEFKPDKLVEVSEIYDEALRRLALGPREDQGIPFLGWTGDDTIDFKVRPKEMTIYTGEPGQGKSNALYQQTAYLVCQLREPVVIASLEEDAEDILAVMAIHSLGVRYDPTSPSIIKAFRALKEEFRNMIFFYYHRNRAPFVDVLKTAEFTIRKHNAKHFVMDSVAKTDLDIEENKDANKFMALLTNSMNETGAHYHVVAHSRKGDAKNRWSIPGLNEIKGSNQFGIETFNCLSFWRDPKKVEMVQEVKEKGFYTKREWNNEDAAPTKGGYTQKQARFKEVEMSAEEVANYPDSVVKVCKQKVGGAVGNFNTFFFKDCYRLERSNKKPIPYAHNIYEEYIKRDIEGDF